MRPTSYWNLVPILLAVIFMGLFRPALAQGAPTAQMNSIQQLCRYREAQILQYNLVQMETNRELARETDPAQRTQLSREIDALNRALERLESSWDRLGCVELIYPPLTIPNRNSNSGNNVTR